MRLLFSSIHCYLDPSSGAALCTRELLEILAARGMDCGVLTTGILDTERETSLEEVLATLELPVRRFQAELRQGGSAEVIDLGVKGVRVTLMPTVSSRAERSPDSRESAIFPELDEQVFDRFRAGAADRRRSSRQPRAHAASAEGGKGRMLPGTPALDEPEALLWCHRVLTAATPIAGVKPE